MNKRVLNLIASLAVVSFCAGATFLIALLVFNPGPLTALVGGAPATTQEPPDASGPSPTAPENGAPSEEAPPTPTTPPPALPSQGATDFSPMFVYFNASDQGGYTLYRNRALWEASIAAAGLSGLVVEDFESEPAGAGDLALPVTTSAGFLLEGEGAVRLVDSGGARLQYGSSQQAVEFSFPGGAAGAAFAFDVHTQGAALLDFSEYFLPASIGGSAFIGVIVHGNSFHSFNVAGYSQTPVDLAVDNISYVPAGNFTAPTQVVPETADLIPQGAPLAEWQGVPVMPQALAGEDLGVFYIYSLTNSETLFDEIVAFYEAAGWEFLGAKEELTVMAFQKDNLYLNISPFEPGEGLLVLQVSVPIDAAALFPE
jgi:hypothetical protein